jgi:formamidopyrimidine-DNA glycosylase
VDQSVIAGLGNLLTDEICWCARLHPSRPVADVDSDDLIRLHAAMTGVLRTAETWATIAARRFPRLFATR